MRTARQILEEVYADTCTRLKDFDMWCIEEAMKEYAKQQAVEYGKFLGLRGISWRGTPTDEQWEWADKSGDLNYDSTEALYNQWTSKNEKAKI